MPSRSDFRRGRPPEPTLQDRLRIALSQGDPQQVQALIEAGADIRYKREHGYDALLDAVHGRDVGRDPRLLELLSLLKAEGVDLFGEHGLHELSVRGRFDGVRFLLEAGADRTQLAWTPLMEAVALGSRSDVEAALAQGGPLEARDRCSRTAWLLAVLTGDIAKATVLRERGADASACGHLGDPPLFYAIEGHHPEMLRWLVSEGADVHQTNDFGSTALMQAVEAGDLPCVEVLLEAGADVEGGGDDTALSKATSRELVLRLLEAGANPSDADQRVLLGLEQSGEAALEAVTADEFRRSFAPRYGERNPDRMRVPFWEAMIRCGYSAYQAIRWFEVERGVLGGPVWCAERFGQSLTRLPDGRAVQIGGEHEDAYMPDFCIYNDVFVHDRDGSIAIYGYPEAVFPPTDFHTATLVGDAIYVIGSLGYHGTRRYGETPVYRLDGPTLEMNRLHPTGDAPGWIYKHRAIAVAGNGIRVWGGVIATGTADVESNEPNLDACVLELDPLRWRREARSGRGTERAEPAPPRPG